jgi:glutathionylspermidine synthase
MIVTAQAIAEADYRYHRNNIYPSIRHTFSWDVYRGQEYALATYANVPRLLQQEISFATEQLGKIFARVAEVVRVGSTELWRELGYPEETWPAITLSGDYHAVTAIGRFDFVYTPQGLKMLEFNSDTPTSIVEAFYANGAVCDYFQVENINRHCDHDIRQVFTDMISYYRDKGYATERIVFCSIVADNEDRGTTEYLLAQSGLPGRYVPLNELAYDPKQERLVAKTATGEFEVVDVLYRLHALEVMAKDRTTKGFPIGPKLLELIANKRLAVINPPIGFIAQTKALQALIWNLYESNVFFTAEERDVIRTYCLPTYLENQFHGKTAYVKKPFFGREGGAVSLFDDTGYLETKDTAKAYWDQPMVYQQRVELPTLTVPTETGEFTGKLLFGSFVLGGKPSAIVARVDKEITGNLSYFLPLAVK